MRGLEPHCAPLDPHIHAHGAEAEARTVLPLPPKAAPLPPPGLHGCHVAQNFWQQEALVGWRGPSPAGSL